LIWHSLKRVRVLVLVLALLLAAFQILLIIIAATFHRSGSMDGLGDMLPPVVREFFGPALSAFLSFGGMISQCYFHPLVIVSLIALAIVIGTIPTAEVESGFIDFILSRPIARHWIVTRAIICAVICISLVVGSMMLSTWAGLTAFGPRDTPWPPLKRILALAANLSLLMLAWSAVAMAIGANSRRRGTAATATGFLAGSTFILDYAGRIWDPAKRIAWISPFHYYSSLEIIMGVPLDGYDLVVLAGIAGIGFTLAYAFFLRRDLAK
jgi:ABC-2 type transport system permease protein